MTPSSTATWSPERGGCAELEVDDAALAGQLDLLDLLERLDAALHLGGLRGMGGEAVDEALLLGQHRLLPRVRRFPVRFPDRTLAFVEVVVAGVARDLSAVDFRDLRGDAVHEVAVVGRHQQRARQRLQERLEPDDRFDVQVVRRLVHQQHVGPAEEHPGHRHAHLPAARERSHIAVDALVGETQAMQHFARLAFERVAPEVLVLFLHLAKPGEHAIHVARGRIGHRVLKRFELVMQRADPSASGDRFVQHRSPGHFLHVLPEVADGQLLRNGDVAFIGSFFAHDHAEQRRLPGAVRPDETDLLSGVELEGCVDEENLTAVLLADPGEGDQLLIPNC